MQGIKKGDTVCVITGQYKGKRGTVIDVLIKKSKVKVRGVGLKKKHIKAKRKNEVSGVRIEESFIELSNVMLMDAKSNRPCRLNFRVNSLSGAKNRISNVSGEIL